MASGTKAGLRQRVEQLEALMRQGPKSGEMLLDFARIICLEAEHAASQDVSKTEMLIIRKDKEDLRGAHTSKDVECNCP